MTTQTTFISRLSRASTRARLGPRTAARMIAYLVRVGGRWVDRAEFASELDINDRLCRLGRAASNGRIVTGQRGYKLMRDATAEERAAHLANLAAQIAALQRQYSLSCRRAHASVERPEAAMGRV